MTTQRTKLVAYSAMEEYELEEYAQAIEREHPDIHLHIERLSTAALYDKLIGEGPDGDWDVIFGWALTTMLAPELQQFFAPLSFDEFATLPSSAISSQKRWFCPSGFVPAFCVDVQQLENKMLPVPTSWQSLADPRYQDCISMPDPRYSGAAFLHLNALLQSSGDEATWKTLSDVAANRPRICQSAFAPCIDVGEGRAAIGVTVSIAAQRMKRMGFPVHMVIPSDAAGYELEGFSLRAGSPRAEAAQRVLQWTFTPTAYDIYRKYNKVIVTSQPHESKLTIVHAETAAARRQAVCATWKDIVLAKDFS